MIDIIVVNWNSGMQLKECIVSVLAHDNGLISRIIVVDNGSTDGSADEVEGFSDIEIVRTGENLGFAAACNIGATLGNSSYLLFLNPDTRLEPSSLEAAFDFMEDPANSQVGICGIQLIDDPGSVSRSCSRFPPLARLVFYALGIDKLPGLHGLGMRIPESAHNNSKRVDQVMGAFFFMRGEAFDACNGFDERFFVYFEEVDLSKRCMLNGWQSWYLDSARAFHAGGGTSRQVKGLRLFYSLRSRLLYAFKHFPGWQAWSLLFITTFIEPFTRAAWCILMRDFKGVKHIMTAYRMFICSISKIIRGEGRHNP